MKPKQLKVVQIKGDKGFIENVGFGREVKRTYKTWGLLLAVLFTSLIVFNFIL